VNYRRTGEGQGPNPQYNSEQIEFNVKNKFSQLTISIRDIIRGTIIMERSIDIEEIANPQFPQGETISIASLEK